MTDQGPIHPDPLDALLALAEAATPGPWWEWNDSRGGGVYSTWENDEGSFVADTKGRNAVPDAAFIAACDPATVVGLIERVREVEGPMEPGYRARAEAAEQRAERAEAEKCTHGQHLFVEADRAIGRALAGERRAAAAEAREQALRDRVTTEKADAWDEGWNAGVAYEEARWRQVCNVRLDSVVALPSGDFPPNPHRGEKA